MSSLLSISQIKGFGPFFEDVNSFLRYRVEKIFLFIDSWRLYKNKSRPLVLINCGANIGQSFELMTKFYSSSSIEHILIEPNPYCVAILQEKYATREQVRVLPYALGKEVGKTILYGIDHKDDRINVGVSVIREHNFGNYECWEHGIEVSVIPLSSIIMEYSKLNYIIVVKIDIEGAEYEVIADLISSNTLRYVNTIYVEFHSKYYEEPKKSETKILEKKYREILRDVSRLRIWH